MHLTQKHLIKYSKYYKHKGRSSNTVAVKDLNSPLNQRTDYGQIMQTGNEETQGIKQDIRPYRLNRDNIPSKSSRIHILFTAHGTFSRTRMQGHKIKGLKSYQASFLTVIP